MELTPLEEVYVFDRLYNGQKYFIPEPELGVLVTVHDPVEHKKEKYIITSVTYSLGSKPKHFEAKTVLSYKPQTGTVICSQGIVPDITCSLLFNGFCFIWSNPDMPHQSILF